MHASNGEPLFLSFNQDTKQDTVSLHALSQVPLFIIIIYGSLYNFPMKPHGSNPLCTTNVVCLELKVREIHRSEFMINFIHCPPGMRSVW